MTRRGTQPGEGALSLWGDERPPVRPVRSSSSGPEQKAAADAVATLDGLPLMLTVEEAAAVLRVSRTSAYKLVDDYRRSNGRDGLPHVRLGGRLLVRRVDLAAIVGL